jgi:hypothetical protein
MGRRRRWAWTERVVDIRSDHLELRYGSANQTDRNAWVAVVRVGPPVARTFPVEWLLSLKAHREAVRSVRKELDFYLVEKGEEDPWAYAQYHCSTAANMYSDVHWAFHKMRTR